MKTNLRCGFIKVARRLGIYFVFGVFLLFLAQSASAKEKKGNETSMAAAETGAGQGAGASAMAPPVSGKEKRKAFAVQLVPFVERANAEKALKELAEKGYAPYIFSAIDAGGRPWHAVRIGDYRKREAAGRAVSDFKKKLRMPAFVTPVDALLPEIAAPVIPAYHRGGDGRTETVKTKPGDISRVEKASPEDNAVRPVEKANPEGNAVRRTVKAEPGFASGGDRADRIATGKTAAAMTARETRASAFVDSGAVLASAGPSPSPGGAGLEGSGEIRGGGNGGGAQSGRIDGLLHELTALREQVERMDREADARKTLAVTDEEKSEKEEEVLSAAGRQYTLMAKGTLGLEYGLRYQYYSSDILDDVRLEVEKRSNHNLTNSIFVEYALRDNLTVSASFPFVYKYDKVGLQGAKDVTDFGDLSFGLQYQPLKSGGKYPTMIFNAGLGLPTGSSPYEIDRNNELSTGSGYYSLNAGLSLSKTFDPVIAFGSFGYSHNFEENDLDQQFGGGRVLSELTPGDSVSFSIGMGYALSYMASLNLSYQLGYYFDTEYRFEDGSSVNSGSSISSMFYIGTGWRVSPKWSFNFKAGIGLTNNDPDFTLSLRLPFEYDLGH